MRNNSSISLLIKIYALTLGVFMLFRIMLLFSEFDRLSFTSETLMNILYAFIIGIRFDIVITGYIMMLPAVIILAFFVIERRNRYVTKIIFYFLLLLFSISFIISAADIPYFNSFFKRFDIGAFEWMDNSLFVFKMIIEEPRYILIVIPLLIIIYLFYQLLKKIFVTYENREPAKTKKQYLKRSIISLLILLLIFIGIRGRVQKKSPIRTGTAYFCHDPFLNQLGLNPVFTFIRSYIDMLDKRNKQIELIDDKIAVENVKRYLDIKDTMSFSPIARRVEPDTVNSTNPNVIIIIMESMSAAKMQRFGNKNNLTPFLDSLSYQSYFFSNIYTAGEHTFNGIFSTLFSFPALYRQHALKKIRRYMGISYTMKKQGYTTAYFTTHDGQFDNVEGFLYANNFDHVISQSNYPMKEVKTTLGVPDDYMFRYSIPKINELYKKDMPFFVTLMTASDHGPFYIPEYFHPKSENIKQQIVEYADWSLNKFLTLASKTDWFNNTIFVFVADHGIPDDVKYPISLNYLHTPLLIYAPKLLKPKQFDNIGGQIDIYPTIMGILGKPYVNNTLGIDLLNEKRPYVIINGDDKVAALDNEFLFILKGNEKMLYNYKKQDRKNTVDKYRVKAKEMEVYLRSNLQTFQYMLLNEETLFDLSAQ